ncbi:MAG: SLC13/DASS family transporter [Bacteroidales bacterium]|nr:SLC13/DASS family transporter [Bacteroidales bacterium]
MKCNAKYIIGFGGGLLLFLVTLLFGDFEPGKPEVTRTLAIALLMAVWWITEVVPLAVTSLLPVVLFPAFGIMDGKDVSSIYFNHVIFLFIGGFLMALAMEKWNLHKRIAIRILMFTGTSPGKILFGFMFATAFLSMWISNTATAMMMVPILLSIISRLGDLAGRDTVRRYSTGLLLGVAYSASIGGIATLVGTPPNLSFARIFNIMFPEGPEISFAGWFVFALPVSILLFILVWSYLLLVFRPAKKEWEKIKSIDFHQQQRELGSASFEEKAVFTVFVMLAFLWLFRSGFDLGPFIIPGWASLFPLPDYLNDGTVAVMAGVILFLIPSKNVKGGRLMDWETARGIPWHIVLLFGGGFALASGFKESGLSTWLGNRLVFIGNYHPLLIIATICFFMTFLTELTSNTATTEMILPLLAGLSVSTQINPLLFMLPATLAGSMAFMLPVATPPNAIIFGTNRITVLDMAKTGLAINLAGIVIITLATWFLGTYVFDIDIHYLPEWVNITK